MEHVCRSNEEDVVDVACPKGKSRGIAPRGGGKGA